MSGININRRRGSDIVARYGGEEFAILLPEINAENAGYLVEQCRKSIFRLQLPHKKSKSNSIVTISLGVSTTVPDAGGEAQLLIDSADKRLYQAKKMVGIGLYPRTKEQCLHF
jgi:diguanylate cyclase (GGDEF)-like protein